MPRTNPLPTEHTVEKVNKSVGAARKDFAPSENILGQQGRQRLAKPRPGAEKIVVRVMDVAARIGLELPNTPSASVVESQAAATRLHPLHINTRALHQSVADTMYAAESHAWSGAMMYYSVLSRLAESDESLRADLQPIADFFARRSSTVRQEQVITRAQRKAEKAEKKAAEAKRAAEAIKARRGDAEAPSPVA